MPRKPPTQDRQPAQGVQALTLALRLLEQLTMNEEPSRVTDLAEILQTSKNRVHRHLRTLVQAGYVVQDPDTERYAPGIRLIQMGNAVANRYDLLSVSRPIMQRLRKAYELTVVLSRVVSNQVYAVEQLVGYARSNLSVSIGTYLELHSSAQGKLVLAFGTDDLLETIMKSPLSAHTPRTIIDPKKLRKAVLAVRRQGFATNFGERENGVNGVAVPICKPGGELFATLVLVGFANQLDWEPVPPVVDELKAAAEEIRSSLFG
ncbi:MAG: IclR family transcriptional regulator [Xanthobacteraceae bacterium]